MSILAYDGKIIAADRQATRGGSRCTCKKLLKVDGIVVGWVGVQVHGLVMMDWFFSGAKPSEFPDLGEERESCTRLIVATRRGLDVYEQSHRAMSYVDKFQAFGSGMDLAMGAMAAGASAIEAVKITCKYDINCGMGVDWFEVR